MGQSCDYFEKGFQEEGLAKRQRPPQKGMCLASKDQERGHCDWRTVMEGAVVRGEAKEVAFKQLCRAFFTYY